MKLKINQTDFDFDGFFDALVVFIEENFGTEKPDAADTLRYFYSFFQPTDTKNSNFPEKDPWSITDFKNIILKGDVSIFFPFSSGLQLDHSVNLANGETVQLSRAEYPSIGMTDCFGFLVSLSKGKFEFRSAVAWGGMTHAVEEAAHPKTDRKMNGFLKSFLK